MREEDVFNETIYVYQILKYYLGHLRLEKMYERNVSLSSLLPEERRKYTPILIDKKLHELDSKHYEQMLREYSKIYVGKVNKYYKTNFKKLYECYAFVANKMNERSDDEWTLQKN